jgi:hypothetical protein
MVFLLMFFLSMWIHAVKGAAAHNDERRRHGEEPVSALAYMGTSRFWFESFQNWQSEFLSLFAMVYLAVYLRQKGSAESKPVATPHDEHGEESPLKATGAGATRLAAVQSEGSAEIAAAR